MKLILLVDSSTEKFEELLLLVKNKKVFFIETASFSEDSGRESIVKYLGDECSQMILCLSCKKKNIYYVENIRETFANLIRAFEKGDHVEI